MHETISSYGFDEDLREQHREYWKEEQPKIKQQSLVNKLIPNVELRDRNLTNEPVRAKTYPKGKVALKILNNSQDITTDFLLEVTHNKLIDNNGHIARCFGISQDPKSLCRPVDETDEKKVYGILPYVAPEVFYRSEELDFDIDITKKPSQELIARVKRQLSLSAETQGESKSIKLSELVEEPMEIDDNNQFSQQIELNITEFNTSN
ncbi:hypothetical protein C1645_837466 [Glomus cerebriforme]|uniref:Protein kinase domain-containing protein n=1 Tax=Glomus cerebriforme TaxID=658196 RepID=A0A397S8J9_9GLOM|nr:hypothetical protein C1645_837466 [Glomus cerebriforme]